MNENEKENQNEKEQKKDDLQTYLNEVGGLESDFSDLEGLDMEELKEMQDAISKVKESEGLTEENKIQNTNSESKQKEVLFEDFSDLDKMDLDELKDMKIAIETVKQTEAQQSAEGSTVEAPPQPEALSQELEEKIKQELQKRKEVEEKVEEITPEKFLAFAKEKRNKIWYHALYYLVFNSEDHIASKSILYDELKDVTSKSAIDHIPEHQFYFGLGYILRLSLYDKQIIRYMPGGKFKINVNIDTLKELLKEAGDPISTKPVIEEKKRKTCSETSLKTTF